MKRQSRSIRWPMRRYGGWAIPLLAILLSTPVSGDPLTLETALERALAQNPGLERARGQVRSEALERKAARARRLPEVSLQGEYTHSSEPNQVWPIHEAGTFPPFDEDQLTSGLYLQLPLYSGGGLIANENLAEQRHEAARLGVDASRQELSFNVLSTYAKVLQLEGLSAAMVRRIESLEAEAADVERRIKEGRAAQIDRIRIQSRLSQARHEAADLESGVANARAMLAVLLGVPKVEAALAPLPGVELEEAGIESWIERAVAANPDLKRLRTEQAASGSELNMARADRKPQLSFVGNTRYHNDSDWDGQNEWEIGLQLSMPLYDGDLRSARVDQAAVGREMAQLALRERRDEVAYEVREAHNGVATSRLQVRVAEMGVREAEEVLRIEKLRYETGAATITDLLDAEAEYWDARATLHQSRYDLEVRKAQLLKSVGELSPARFGAQTVNRREGRS